MSKVSGTWGLLFSIQSAAGASKKASVVARLPEMQDWAAVVSSSWSSCELELPARFQQV